MLGADTPVQRCIRHKERKVLEHLPERDRPTVKRRLRAAWKLDAHAAARERLQTLAGELDHSHPGRPPRCARAGGDAHRHRLGVRGALKRTLTSTNPCESMIECVRRSSPNVKRWQSGEMCLRWTAAGMLEAERQSCASSATPTSPTPPSVSPPTVHQPPPARVLAA